MRFKRLYIRVERKKILTDTFFWRDVEKFGEIPPDWLCDQWNPKWITDFESTLNSINVYYYYLFIKEKLRLDESLE